MESGKHKIALPPEAIKKIAEIVYSGDRAEVEQGRDGVKVSKIERKIEYKEVTRQ